MEESLQATIEELETSNEELQSMNEELHAANEELLSVSSEHRRKIEELTALTADMEHLLHCTDVGTILLDHDNRIKRFTPAIAKAFNLLERDVGRPIEHVTACFAYPELPLDIAEVARGSRVIERTVVIDNATFLLRVFPFRIADTTRGTVITLVDISEVKKAELALEARNRELARVNASLEQFTYIVSHDLRAPLRSIINSARWIEEDLGASLDENVRAHCHRLVSYCSRMTDMLDALLAYSRLNESSKSGDRALADVDIRQLVTSTAEAIDDEGRMTLVLVGDMPTIACRRAPLQLVFQNLLDNALKYAGRPGCKVTVGAEDLGDRWRFLVTDDGPGIPQRHHDKVFLPFRKLEHADEKPGTGMGLALVRKAVDDNGGEIKVLSSPETGEAGCSFVFTWAKADGAA